MRKRKENALPLQRASRASRLEQPAEGEDIEKLPQHRVHRGAPDVPAIALVEPPPPPTARERVRHLLRDVPRVEDDAAADDSTQKKFIGQLKVKPIKF